MAKKKSELDQKIAKIMKEGVRRNTHAPLSKTNKRRPVSQKQAVAIARSMMGLDNKKKKTKKGKLPKRLFAFKKKNRLTKYKS